MTIRPTLLTAIGVLAVATCGGAGASSEREMAMGLPATALADITDTEWNALASRRIYFGHQSVGRDIMQGVRRVLDANPSIPLRTIQADDPNSVEGPGFIEGQIGHNRQPETKTADFLRAMRNGFAKDAASIAMYKFCYVDVSTDTDPDQLFRHYEAAIGQLQRQHPELTVVHFTLPLHLASDGLREQARTLLGRPTQIRLNMIRNRYNELLRQRYGATAPVFDIALVESTRPDGTQAFTRYGGRKVFMLAPEWTYDGGHLTDAAQDHVAERLLVFLATLETKESAAELDTTTAATENRDNTVSRGRS